MTDIDTQIEEILMAGVPTYEAGKDRLFFTHDNTVKAIKTLLIQSIDDALANQATPTASGKQVDKSNSGAYHDGYRDGYQTAKHEALQKFENENYQ